MKKRATIQATCITKKDLWNLKDEKSIKTRNAIISAIFKTEAFRPFKKNEVIKIFTKDASGKPLTPEEQEILIALNTPLKNKIITDTIGNMLNIVGLPTTKERIGGKLIVEEPQPFLFEGNDGKLSADRLYEDRDQTQIESTEAGEDLLLFRGFLKTITSWKEDIEKLEPKRKELEEKGDIVYNNYEGTTFVDIGLPFEIGNKLGVTEQEKNTYVEIYGQEKVDTRLYSSSDDLHDGKENSHCIRQRGCEGSDPTKRTNIPAKEKVLGLKEKGYEVAAINDLDSIEKKLGDMYDLSYELQGDNKQIKVAQADTLGTYDRLMSLDQNDKGERAFRIIHGDNRGSYFYYVDDYSGRFLVLKMK